MACNTTQQSAPGSCTISDLLHILPSSAHETLYNSLKANDSLSHARSSCRALRALVDGQTSDVDMRLGLAPARLLAAFHGGRWLQRRPRCTHVCLSKNGGSLDALAVPFATAPPEACRRVTSLGIQGGGRRPSPIPGLVLLTLTSRLPLLRSLRLSEVAPPAQDTPLDRQMASYALSLLPSLSSLSVEDPRFLRLVPDSLAAQLTQLHVCALGAQEDRPTAEMLAATCSKMAAIKELSILYPRTCPFAPQDVSRLLDAPPLSALESLTLYPVGNVAMELNCSFAGGCLDAVDFGKDPAPYSKISAILGTAVLRSRAMGPRLRLLTLAQVDVDAEPPNPDPAAALYARCNGIQLGNLMGCRHVRPMLCVVRLLGLPQMLTWDAGKVYTCLTVDLLRNGSEAGGRHAGSAPVVLPTATLIQRCLERIARTVDENAETSVVLRGPFVRGLIASPRALEGWLQDVVAALPSKPMTAFQYRALPTCGAVLLEYNAGSRTAPVVRAVAEAALPLGGAADGDSPAQVEAVSSSLLWSDAAVQVLEALWDGEEEEGEAGAPAAEAPAGGSPGGAEARTAAELERLRCLLETWEGLRDVPKSLELY
ncbi:hypothetical protein HYH03_000048 [Edaphochlamys debaryana]|uniref:Uncharacterized protein n=1 Tax=Edaphochlamys debaryana TaxID=47281 RepID=A0A835YFE4_9CHLO|nr:hypothetical protein HYH03_000048 [Edaphochlamys debaryana]|eukprot:KAG2501541.1 hypothetical protein HYH03_000048 [Edaphochlamys debaryana]